MIEQIMQGENSRKEICLFGGNIVRPMYGALKKNYSVNYIPWISPISLMYNKCDNCHDIDTYMNKNLIIEFEKDFLKYVPNSRVIILDLEPLSYPNIIYKNTKFTDTGDFRKTNFYNRFIKEFSYEKNIFQNRELVLEAVEKFADVLMQKFERRNIILIRHGKALYHHIGNHIIANNGVVEYNELMSLYEQKFIECTGCIEIDIWKSYFSEYGRIPANYEEDFYADIFKKVDKALKNDEKKPRYNKADFVISLKRYLYYYEFANLRKFVTVFLDFEIFFEKVLSFLGKGFIEKYFAQIVELHDTIQNCSDYDKILKSVAKVGEKELYSGFAAVFAIINRNYCICDDFSVMFQYNFQILGNVKNLIKSYYSENNIALADVNSQNMDTLFEYMINNDVDEMPQELLSCTYRTPIDIWGSCISREIFNLKDEEVYVNKYCFRVSLLNVGMPPIKVDKSIYNLNNFCGNEWMQRCTLIEWNRTAKEYLASSVSDWLLVDVSTILYPTYSYCNQDFTMAFALKGTPFWNILAKDIKLIDYTKKEYTDEYFIERMREAVKVIRERYGSKVILIDTMWCAEVVGVDRKIREWDWINDFERYRIARRNHISVLCEDYLQKELDCYRITYTRQFLSDEFFPGGESSQLHYEETFYREAYNTIVSIIKTKPDKRVYDNYRIKTRIRRIVDLNRCPENRHYLDKVFNRYKLDSVLLNMPVDIALRYADVLERFYLSGYADVDEIMQNYDFATNGCVELKQYLCK